MYFLLSIALNDLPFDFARCSLDPILQEQVNKQTKKMTFPELSICVPLHAKIISSHDLLPLFFPFLFLLFLVSFGGISK